MPDKSPTTIIRNGAKAGLHTCKVQLRLRQSFSAFLSGQSTPAIEAQACCVPPSPALVRAYFVPSNARPVFKNALFTIGQLMNRGGRVRQRCWLLGCFWHRPSKVCCPPTPDIRWRSATGFHNRYSARDAQLRPSSTRPCINQMPNPEGWAPRASSRVRPAGDKGPVRMRDTNTSQSPYISPTLKCMGKRRKHGLRLRLGGVGQRRLYQRPGRARVCRPQQRSAAAGGAW